MDTYLFICLSYFLGYYIGMINNGMDISTYIDIIIIFILFIIIII